MKGKEREAYTHLNAELQRIARREKKAFLSDQCKKVEENNRMGKTRDVFKKIRDIKGTLRIPTARRSNQSILKEISPEYSLEGLMLKLKLQYFDHLM